jgi:uncharacterized phage protein (TIGR01671 family)
MNDRFKFRFWHKPTNKMIDCYGFNKDFVFGDTLDGIGTTYNPAKFEDCILMQCTGLKDKNGKLIYEGDIVRLKAKNGMNFDYAVKYKNYCFILEYINGRLKGTKARDFAKQYAQPQKMYEHGYMVIGNIYENKDLLKCENQ